MNETVDQNRLEALKMVVHDREIERRDGLAAERGDVSRFERPWPQWRPDRADPADEAAFPESAEAFARSVIFAICTAGVSASVARRMHERCCRALALGATVRLGFRHPGKADAIDRIWRERAALYRAYRTAADRLAFLDTLPWIGPVTKHRLAARLGLLDEAERAASHPLKAVA